MQNPIEAQAYFEARMAEITAKTAKDRNDPSIHSPADFLPLMPKAHFPKRYTLDLSYGEGEAQKLDIFYPDDGDGPFPVFAEVHGGGWYFGQKRSDEFEPFLLGLSRGYAVVSLGYTLSPKAHFPQAVEELKGAIRYLKAHAAELRLDPSRIALWGGSAGAHLAAMAAMTAGTGVYDNPLYGNLQVDSSVACLVLWYGCFDFTGEDEQRRILRMPPKDSLAFQNFVGNTEPWRHPDLMAKTNPERYITPFAPPTLLQHGLSDRIVPFLQSVHFYEAMKTKCAPGRAVLDLLPNCDHADHPLFAEENVAKVYDFVDSILL